MTDLNAIEVSIVVACRNEGDCIRGFVESLLAQRMGRLRWEAIIADGVSTDSTLRILEEICDQWSNFRVISNPGRTVSKGLNAAIRLARGRYILRMDAHTVYSETYCVDCVTTLESSGADNAGGPARTRVHGVKASAIAAAYHSRFSTGGARFHDPKYEGWVDTVTYGCWRRDVFERIGMFDEDLVRNQDDEFNLRLIRSGGRIWQSPGIVSWYSPRSTFSGLFLQYFQYGFWKVFVIRKHRLPGSWRHLVPVLLVLAMATPPVMAVLAAIAGASSIGLAGAELSLALILAYVTAIFTASLLTARANSSWRILPFLPVAFAAFHFSYGSGFLMALLQSPLKARRTGAGDSIVARITR